MIIDVKPYPDELLYSVLARMYVRSGSMNYRSFAQTIYEGRIKKSANVEFFNELKEDVKTNLKRYKPIEDYTMYGWYSDFIPNQEAALDVVRNARPYCSQQLKIPAPKGEIKRYLRYCPKCVREDREKYGEAYWKRFHQMIGVDVCATHGCLLDTSSVEITGSKKEDLYPAELYVNDKAARFPPIDLHWKYARYARRVMRNKSYNYDVSRYIKSILDGTKYVSPRSGSVNIKRLYGDISYEFQRMNNIYLLSNQSQITAVLKGILFNPAIICQIAMFFGVTSEELLKGDTKCFKEPDSQAFDDRVRKMLEAGIGSNETARLLRIDTKTVYNIKNGK